MNTDDNTTNYIYEHRVLMGTILAHSGINHSDDVELVSYGAGLGASPQNAFKLIVRDSQADEKVSLFISTTTLDNIRLAIASFDEGVAKYLADYARKKTKKQ